MEPGFKTFLVGLLALVICGVVTIPLANTSTGNEIGQISSTAMYVYIALGLVALIIRLATRNEELVRWSLVPTFFGLFGWMQFSRSISENLLVNIVVAVLGAVCFVGIIHLRWKYFDNTQAIKQPAVG